MRAVIAVLTGLALVSFSQAAPAKTLREVSSPAELPPPGFKGRQFVDSRGCAFIRTGYGGTVTWVPRVTRSRKVLCGYRPTFAGNTQATQPVRKAQGRKQTAPVIKPRLNLSPTTTQPTLVSDIYTDQSSSTYRKDSSEHTRKQRRRSGWGAFLFGSRKPDSSSDSRNETSSDVYRKPSARTPSRPVVAPAPQGWQGQGSAVVAGGTRPAQPSASIPARNFVPKGYYSLLDDAGTQALRGVGTPQGKAAMDLIWTETVPRRLIDVTTGQDVTARYPQIRYPYQTASLRPYVPAGTVARHHKRKRSYRHKKATAPQNCSCVCKPAEVICTPKVKQGKKPRIKDEAAPANMKYYHKVNDVSATNGDMRQGRKRGVLVQVATFGVPANARRTLARFRSAGMPVLSKPLRRGGKSYDIVMLGPFTDAASLARALKAARSAGFSDAFTLRR